MLVLHNRMSMWKGEIVRFLIWCDVCLLNSSLLEFLWGEALKTVAYILNQGPNKYVIRLHMSYGHIRSLVIVTSMFGDAKRK